MSLELVTRVTLLATVVALAGEGRAAAKGLTLVELVEIARRANPSVLASGAAVEAMEAQASEARRNWLPSGEFLSFVAPVPRLECRGAGMEDPPPGTTRNQREANCVSTNVNARDNPSVLTQIAGPWWRTDLRLVQPL